jgi:uncharacterized protein (DUF58 family)
VRRAGAIAAFGAALAACGGAFGAVSLAVPGLGMLLVGLLAPAWVLLAAAGARIERRDAPRAVLEDAPWSAALAVRRGPLALPGVEVEDQLLGDPVVPEPWVALRERATFPRRGRVTLPSARLVARDPLRLATRVASQTGPGELLVLPRLDPVSLPPDVAGAAGDGATGARGAREPAFEIEGVGPYRPSTPMSRIHWAALARHDQLMERRFHSDVDASALVVLDGRPAGGDFDAAVRASASLARALAMLHGVGVLLPGEEYPFEVAADLHAWAELHERLALVQPDGRTPALHPHVPARAIFWVSAAPGAEAPHALLARSSLLPCFLVVPQAAPGTDGFAVAGLHAARLAPGGRRRAA